MKAPDRKNRAQVEKKQIKRLQTFRAGQEAWIVKTNGLQSVLASKLSKHQEASTTRRLVLLWELWGQESPEFRARQDTQTFR